MTYRISAGITFIFLAAVGVLWYQGFRIYPFSYTGEPIRYQTDSTGGISINDARRISTLKLDFTLFDNPLYKSLQLREVTVGSADTIPHGRTNPFAGGAQ